MERLRGSAHQQHRDDLHELQIGRLKQDRVHIPRGGEVSRGERGENVFYQYVNIQDSIAVNSWC